MLPFGFPTLPNFLLYFFNFALIILFPIGLYYICKENLQCQVVVLIFKKGNTFYLINKKIKFFYGDMMYIIFKIDYLLRKNN